MSASYVRACTHEASVDELEFDLTGESVTERGAKIAAARRRKRIPGVPQNEAFQRQAQRNLRHGVKRAPVSLPAVTAFSEDA